MQYAYFEHLFENITLPFIFYHSLGYNGIAIIHCFVHKRIGGVQNVGDTRDRSLPTLSLFPVSMFFFVSLNEPSFTSRA